MFNMAESVNRQQLPDVAIHRGANGRQFGTVYSYRITYIEPNLNLNKTSFFLFNNAQLTDCKVKQD